MKKSLLTTLLLLTLYCFTPAQINEGAYISGSLGGYSSGSTNQLRPRNTPSVVFSTGFGFPLLKQVYLYTKLSYIARSNYTAQEYHNFIDSDLEIVSELVEANASFSQLLFNGGLQYNIFIADDITLGINSGITYALVNHKASLPNGIVFQRLDNTGLFGAFGGISLEKSYEDSGFSLFGEAQYNYAKKDIVYFRDKFSGMNFTVGGKFYLN